MIESNGLGEITLSDMDRLKHSLKRVGEFIAYFEMAEQKMFSWQHSIDQKMKDHHCEIDQQLKEIHNSMLSLKEMVTEVGVARWRLAAEASLAQGKEHLESIKKATQAHLSSVEKKGDKLNEILEKSFERLDQAMAYTIKHIAEAVSTFKIDDFQELTQKSCTLVKETSQQAILQLHKTIKWSSWKILVMAFLLGLFAVVGTGLYLNGEMPWDIHKKIIAQRHAGAALMNAWPTLSDNEKGIIMKYVHKSILSFLF